MTAGCNPAGRPAEADRAPRLSTPHRRTYVLELRCLRCGRAYADDAVEYVCSCRPNVGSDLGTLDVVYDYAALRESVDRETIANDAERTMGRYAALLPIAGRDSLPSLAVGDTPLLPAPRLASEFGLTNLFVKDDGRNPSGSLKDRASAIAVARCREAGYPVVATASTGNAAAALASQSAAAGLPNIIFVPQRAPVAKLAQLLVHGSRVLAIDGTYDQAFDLCTVACEEFGWYNRNTGYNPYMSEGKKTVSFEISAQLADHSQSERFVSPDAVFVAAGDGCITGGVYKGFYDMVQLGWIEHMPRIYAVQSEQSAALHVAWRNDWEVPQPVQATTRADSINVDSPRDAVKALRAVRESGGAFVVVSDGEILDAIAPMARLAAVFAEPAGAAALAGLRKALSAGLVTLEETIVVINTGNGLKDVPAAMQVGGKPSTVAPTIGAVREALSL